MFVCHSALTDVQACCVLCHADMRCSLTHTHIHELRRLHMPFSIRAACDCCSRVQAEMMCRAGWRPARKMARIVCYCTRLESWSSRGALGEDDDHRAVGEAFPSALTMTSLSLLGGPNGETGAAARDTIHSVRANSMLVASSKREPSMIVITKSTPRCRCSGCWLSISNPATSCCLAQLLLLLHTRHTTSACLACMPILFRHHFHPVPYIAIARLHQPTALAVPSASACLSLFPLFRVTVTPGIPPCELLE